MAEGFSSICSVFTHLHWQKQQINKCLNRNHSQDCHLLFYFLHDGQCPKPVGKQSNGCILNLAAYEMVVYLLINAVWGMREDAVTSPTVRSGVCWWRPRLIVYVLRTGTRGLLDTASCSRGLACRLPDWLSDGLIYFASESQFLVYTHCV